MDRPDVFMPLYIGDYLAGTSRLTTELHGAYLLLIMDYWMNGPLPDNDQALASIARMNLDAWSIAQASLKHYFSIENGKWIHKRIEQELANAVAKKEKANKKAVDAANKRWGNATSNAPSIGQAMLEECPSPSPSPSTLKEYSAAQSANANARSAPPPYDEIFDLFNQVVTDAPQIQSRSERRKTYIRRIWNLYPAMQSPEKWEAFFNHVCRSDFLTGRNNKFKGLSFDWILKEENFAKIIEGNYDNE